LWRMTFEEFEQAVAARYFASAYCTATDFKGQTSLDRAARLAWPDFSDEENASFRETMAQQLLLSVSHRRSSAPSSISMPPCPKAAFTRWKWCASQGKDCLRSRRAVAG
jgi:hypothetical protein